MTTTAFGVSPQRVAEILRQARENLNNGKNWIRDNYKMELKHIDPETREELYDYKGDATDPKTGKPLEGYGYCTLGAIREIVPPDSPEYKAALFEMVQIVNPDYVQDKIADWQYETNWDHYNDRPLDNTKPDPEDLMNYFGIDYFETQIADENDDPRTTWKDVRSWFTKTASRLAKRK